MPRGIYPRKPREKTTIDKTYYKTKQVCLTGKTLLMFEHDVKQQEERESTLLRNIVKNYYRDHPPFGYGLQTRNDH